MEIWKDVVGYEGLYQVSNLGRVRSVGNDRICVSKYGKEFIRPFRNRTLKPTLGKRGYFTVMLFRFKVDIKRIPVHTLVAIAFLGVRPPGLDINHKDGDKTNNSVCNLEYVTKSENMQHAIRNGLLNNSGESFYAAKLNNVDVMNIRKEHSTGHFTNRFLSIKYRVCSSHISKIVNNKCWRHTLTP